MAAKGILTQGGDGTAIPAGMVGELVTGSNLLSTSTITGGAEDVAEKPWGVDYGRITPILVKAIQELNTLVTSQQALIAELQAKVEALETK